MQAHALNARHWRSARRIESNLYFMIPLHHVLHLQFCANIQTCNRLISEEADRRIDLPSIPIISPTHWEPTSEIVQSINLTSESGWAATIKREFIDSSAIYPDLFEVAISIVEDTGYWEPNELLGQSVSRQWQTRKPHSYGALAVLSNEDDSLWQAKPKNPRIGKKGKAQRYESIKGNGSRAFLPIVPPEIRAKISQRYKVIVPSIGSFWSWLENHPEIPIILTEGGKKSLSLLSQGYVAIALYGAYAGVLKWETIGGERVRRVKSELIGDLKRFTHPQRQWSIALDQDSNLKTHYKVQGAIADLGFHLEQAGGKVSIAQWHGQNGRCKGVDDLIVNAGVAAWEKALSEATSFSQWSIARRLTHEVRRKPNLNIQDREFVEVALELPKSGIVALYGGKGSGKSKAIAELVKGLKWLSITHLSSLGRDQAAGWGGVFVNDGDRHGSNLLKDGVPVNGGSVCVPSLLKVSAVDADVLVLDEVSAVLEFLLISKLANKDGMRSLLLSEFYQRVRAARLVLIACADMSEEALQFIESIRGERAYLVKSERKALTYEATIIDGSKNAAIALLQDRIKPALDSKIIYINADAKAFAEMLAEILGRAQTLLITGDTSGGKIEASFLASKGRDLPGLVAQGVRYIISSPSVTQGFSIEHHTDLIDSVWGFYSGCSISAHSIAQAPDRIRNSEVPRFFWIANKGSATSRLSKAQSIPAFLKEFKQLNSAAVRLVAHSLTPEAKFTAEATDWQSQNLRMLAALEVRRNRGMFQLKETLIALLKKEGKRVSICKPQISKVELSEIGATVSRASSAVKTRYHEAVASAATIDKVEAKALSELSEAITSDQVLSREKFYIAEFYRLEEVAVSDVAFDKKGATRSQIKALEAVLSPQLATETTARTINQNPENPQDWNSISPKVLLLEQSGSAALIRAIVAREVELLDSKLTNQIAACIRAHAADFRTAFKFRNVAALSDQQILGEILSRHGIKTKRRGNKNNLRYEVCKPELEALIAIIERRKIEIASPLDQEVNQRDAIAAKDSENPEKWLTPESLNAIREQWRLADCPELQAALRQVIPIEVLERVIA